MGSVVEEAPGQRARAALDRHAWAEAYEFLSEADRAGEPTPEDLEVLAQSAWWVGRQDIARDAWERAYTLHAKAGDKLAATNAAAQLAFNLLGAGLPSVLNGWVNRAERLLQGASEQPMHGLLAVVRGMTPSRVATSTRRLRPAGGPWTWGPLSASRTFRRWGCTWRVGPWWPRAGSRRGWRCWMRPPPPRSPAS